MGNRLTNTTVAQGEVVWFRAFGSGLSYFLRALRAA
jgi:hypothetical protein